MIIGRGEEEMNSPSLPKQKPRVEFRHLTRNILKNLAENAEPSVKTLNSPLSAEIWRHYVLSGGTQRRYIHTLSIDI